MDKSCLNLSREELQRLVYKVDRESFSASFHYHGHVEYNRRFRRTGAAYYPATDVIKVNPKFLILGYKTLIGIIRHELCHFYIYHLVPDARPHGKEFKYLLKTVGGLYTSPTPPERVIHRYFYQCQECGDVMSLINPLIFKMRFYHCPKCGGDIQPIEHRPEVHYEYVQHQIIGH